ncbi:hypothetical protein Tco_1520852 [Tanacetum coccineum]
MKHKSADSINQAWEILDLKDQLVLTVTVRVSSDCVTPLMLVLKFCIFYLRSGQHKGEELDKIFDFYYREVLLSHPRIFNDDQGLGLEERQLDEMNMMEVDSLYYGRKLLAVADLNSNTSTLLSNDRWKNLAKIGRTVTKEMVTKSGTVVNDVAVDQQDSQEPNSATRQPEVKGFGEFKRDFMDYPRKGIGRGR